jgi:hypothetical protein
MRTSQSEIPVLGCSSVSTGTWLATFRRAFESKKAIFKQTKDQSMQFKVLTALFWAVTACRFVGHYHIFEGPAASIFRDVWLNNWLLSLRSCGLEHHVVLWIKIFRKVPGFIFLVGPSLKNRSLNWTLCVICTMKMVLIRTAQLQLESYGHARIGLQN